MIDNCAVFLRSKTLFKKNARQDKVVLINGDTLKCQVLKLGQGVLTIKNSSFEQELVTGLISKMILQSGKETMLHEIPANLDCTKRFLVLEYADDLVSEIQLMFPNAERRDFTIKNISETSMLPLGPLSFPSKLRALFTG